MSCGHEHCNCGENHQAGGRAEHSQGDREFDHGDECGPEDHASAIAAGSGTPIAVSPTDSRSS